MKSGKPNALGLILMLMFMVPSCQNSPATEVIKATPEASSTPGETPTSTITPSLPTATPTITPSPTPAGPTATLAYEFPAGSFHKEDGDGYWVMTFDPGGTFTLNVGERKMVRDGKFILQHNLITLTDDSTPCRGLGSGTYSWTLDGDKLRFELFEDKCQERRRTIGSTWRPGS